MASLLDFPLVIKKVGIRPFIGRVVSQVAEDNLPAWAAAMAYAWLFAIFPMLIFILSLLPYLPDRYKNQAEVQLKEMLQSTPGADVVWQNVVDVLSRPREGLIGVGFLLTLWASSGGMNMTMVAINRCYEVTENRKFYKQRPLAILLTVVVAILIFIVMVLLPVGTTALRHFGPRLHGATIVALNIVRWSIALLVMYMVIAVIYHFGPSVKQRFRLVTPGATFTIAVWVLLGVGFRFYVDKVGSASYNRTYGTVGGVVILLLNFFLDALVLLVGAEINSELDFELYGVPRGARNFTGAPVLVRVRRGRKAVARPAQSASSSTAPPSSAAGAGGTLGIDDEL